MKLMWVAAYLSDLYLSVRLDGIYLYAYTKVMGSYANMYSTWGNSLGLYHLFPDHIFLTTLLYQLVIILTVSAQQKSLNIF